jgi:predicted alpha/beta hydrolase
VALQWAARRSPELRPAGSGPQYERIHQLLNRCAELQRPALLVSISDDAFTGATGTKRLLSYYPRLFPLKHVVFTPAEAGARRLGHFGFFRRAGGSVLWPRFLEQLESWTNSG